MPVAAEAADTQVSGAADTRVSAAAPVQAELVGATVELELAVAVPAMARAITHPVSRQDATAATAAMGKDPTHREVRLERRFIVLLRVRKAGLLPGSLLGRRATLGATTSREINPELVLPGNPTCSPVISREQIGISGSSALRLQGV
jgi:hypothetical protein